MYLHPKLAEFGLLCSNLCNVSENSKIKSSSEEHRSIIQGLGVNPSLIGALYGLHRVPAITQNYTLYLSHWLWFRNALRLWVEAFSIR